MKKNTFLILVLISLAFSCSSLAQVKNTSSGIISLKISLDETVDNVNIGALNIANPYHDNKPIAIQNKEKKYYASFFTFGPTIIQLTIENKPYFFIAYPNENINVKVSKNNEGINVDYQEDYINSIFKDSQSLPRYTYNIYNAQKPNFKYFETANDFRDDRLNAFYNAASTFKSTIPLNEISKKFVYNNIYYITLAGCINYAGSIEMNNRNAQQREDSTTTPTIPPRDLSYYDRLITKNLLDTTSLLSATYPNFMLSLINDSFLNLPKIEDSKPDLYFNAIKEKLSQFIGDERNLFYDMLISSAYIQQLDGINTFSDSQIEDIKGFFSSNEGIRDYLLEENKQAIIQASTVADNTHYLPKNMSEEEILNSILKLNPGKIVVLDFWATWCGPCIQAFSKFTEIKEKYKDVLVFVYITDESSNKKSWNEYTNLLSGTHYYLSEAQKKYFSEKFNFDAIPTYVVFGKDGKHLQTKTANLSPDELEKWIANN